MKADGATPAQAGGVTVAGIGSSDWLGSFFISDFMTTEQRIELLKMKHTRACAEIGRFAANAIRESAQGGWQVDWEEAMKSASGEASECEEKIEALLKVSNSRGLIPSNSTGLAPSPC